MRNASGFAGVFVTDFCGNQQTSAMRPMRRETGAGGQSPP
jgi:hypothetical protein